MARTDIHSVSKIVPHNYEHVLTYSLATQEDGWPVPACGVNCMAEFGSHGTGPCCVIGIRENGGKYAAHGGTGNCTVCGAAFIYGTVWQHLPTGEYIHMGHDCAAKYEMAIDRDTVAQWEGVNHKARLAAAKDREQAHNNHRKAAFLQNHPGLEEALAAEHYIIQNIRESFNRYDLSDKQVALVLRLAEEAKSPTVKNVPAPVSDKRVTFTGKVVSIKMQEGFYGLSRKVTLKVTTPDGEWLAWGTLPAALDSKVVGDEITVSAKLKAGRDAHFAIMERPTAK